MRAALVLIVALSAPVAEQENIRSQLLLRQIAETYRAGDTAAALKLLREHDTPTQRRMVRELLETQPTAHELTVALLRAAGAVHMEAALDSYVHRRGDITEAIVTQLEIGELVYDEVARLEAQPSAASRWEWAIGQRALSDGEYVMARSILVRACARYRHQAMLVLACGIVHETFGLFNIDLESALRAVHSPRSVHKTSSSLLGFREARKDNLKRAREAFEEVLAAEPSSVEAALRLGHVRLREGDPARAARVLEPLVRVNAERRITYLSRLFLGRAREQQQRFDEAIALFQEAVTLLPAQSARLSLANRFHAAGRYAEALALAEAAASERDLEDPWGGYRLGQYWLIEPMLEKLRRQARQGTDAAVAAATPTSLRPGHPEK